MKRTLEMAAPYLAVVVFWCVLENAWLTILAYHAQILFWSGRRLPRLARGWDVGAFLSMALPCALVGPLACLLLPQMTLAGGVGRWLAEHQLTGTALLVMIPYFGLVHPLLEQAHWSGLRAATWQAHPAFAGYHALVLVTLMKPAWLALCLVILAGASVLWSRVQSEARGGVVVPACGHVLADLGLVVAAWARSG